MLIPACTSSTYHVKVLASFWRIFWVYPSHDVFKDGQAGRATHTTTVCYQSSVVKCYSVINMTNDVNPRDSNLKGLVEEVR